ncbi:FAD-dependent oxidoreductase [Nocardiopsis potens]|uniref:FAD-dependent oxidoreductase n=1 Tax=Nocardiopsis potens TaxID=1246458 RepID=UPI000345E3C5|nr:FAD-dependent oxidoreductase [Nocardiopsis potens]
MKAVIIGAGIAGLALAQRLDAHGWQVTVVERAPGPRPQGYMIDFFGPGYDAAELMGVLPRIQELGHRVDEAIYVDEKGRRRASVDFSAFSASISGGLVSIMRPDLERALRESLPERVEIRYGTGPRRITEEAGGVRVELSDGTALEADLLAGADGVHSAVRRLVFGEEQAYLRYLGFHTAAYVFTDARVHALAAGRFHLTDTIGAQVGLYALDGDRAAVFTVHRTPDPALPEDPRAELRRVYARLGWVVPRALELCPPPEEVYYDQVAQIEMDRWSRGRTVLVGDACYAVSLLAGQGASLGIGGAFVLGEELARAGTVEEGLRRYEERWRPVAEERQRAARVGTRWFLPDGRTRLWVRRQALRAAGFVPGLGNFIAGSLTGKPSRVVKDVALEEAARPR